MLRYQDVYTKEMQENIAAEFTRLKDLCYLDHSGTTLYSEPQIRAVSADLCHNVYGNPHSLNTSSRYATDVVDQARYSILRHFNTDPDEYSVIFTAGATASLKLVVETFDYTGRHSVDDNENFDSEYDGTPGTFMYLKDNHTSVLGMRELAVEKGASMHCLPLEDAFETFNRNNESPIETDGKRSGNSLFVYPAQCNYTGVKYPLQWIHRTKEGFLDAVEVAGKPRRRPSKWYCYVDAAAYVSSNPLDLSALKPDFVCMSFYKIFGYPTGLGALLVRNASANVLNKVFFGGGTVALLLSGKSYHVPRPILHDKYEDGTISFLSIISLRHGFDTLRRLTHDMSLVARHTFGLARYVHHHLLMLHHGNGAPAAAVYAETDYESVETQGNIVNFNLLRANGEHVGFMEVSNLANLYNVQLRTGCFCNSGACQRSLALTDDDIIHNYQQGHVCGDERDLINGKPTGSIRISFGYMTTREDADRFLAMVQTCFVQGAPVHKLPHWWNTFRREYRSRFKDHFRGTLEEHEVLPDHPEEKNGTPHVNATNHTAEDLLPKVASLSLGEDGLYLQDIYVYPVKSCAGFTVESWPIDSRGLRYDREWMVVTPAGVGLTQKQNANMCLVKPTVDLEAGKLCFEYPGMPSASVPLQPPSGGKARLHESSLCQSKVCGDRIQGWDCGDEIAEWLSRALERGGIRLIRQWSDDKRSTKQKKGHDGNGPVKPMVSLSNQAQFLLINANSVEWLSEKMDYDEACNVDTLSQRFRSNLVVQGAEAFAENHWKTLRIGNIHFQSEGPCTRCQMICIDQTTGEKSREPLRTLAASFHGKMRFGVYMSHVAGDGAARVSVGDEVVPLTSDRD